MDIPKGKSFGMLLVSVDDIDKFPADSLENYDREDLLKELKAAEKVENYERCAEILKIAKSKGIDFAGK